MHGQQIDLRPTNSWVQKIGGWCWVPCVEHIRAIGLRFVHAGDTQLHGLVCHLCHVQTTSPQLRLRRYVSVCGLSLRGGSVDVIVYMCVCVYVYMCACVHRYMCARVLCCFVRFAFEASAHCPPPLWTACTQVFVVNALAPLMLTQALLPQLESPSADHTRGRYVVNVRSTHLSLSPPPHPPSTTTAAIRTYSCATTW